MPTPTLKTAEKHHANAAAVLAARLEAGEPTAEARLQLRRSEEELAAAQAREAERQAEAAAALEVEAQEMTAALGSEILERLAAILAHLAEPELPTLPEDAALRLVGARQARAEAERALEAMDERRNALGARLAALRAELTGIGDRRALGSLEDGDEARAHLLTVDVDGLSRLVEDLAAERGPLAQDLADAVQAHELAADGFRRATAVAKRTAFEGLGDRLERALAQLALDMWALSTARIDVRWMPRTREFRRALENSGWGMGITR